MIFLDLSPLKLLSSLPDMQTLTLCLFFNFALITSINAQSKTHNYNSALKTILLWSFWKTTLNLLYFINEHHFSFAHKHICHLLDMMSPCYNNVLLLILGWYNYENHWLDNQSAEGSVNKKAHLNSLNIKLFLQFWLHA